MRTYWVRRECEDSSCAKANHYGCSFKVAAESAVEAAAKQVVKWERWKTFEVRPDVLVRRFGGPVDKWVRFLGEESWGEGDV